MIYVSVYTARECCAGSRHLQAIHQLHDALDAALAGWHPQWQLVHSRSWSTAHVICRPSTPSVVRNPSPPAIVRPQLMHWTDALTSKLGTRTKMVGSALTCEGAPKGGDAGGLLSVRGRLGLCWCCATLSETG